jgi:hypothetical protein
VVDPHDRLSDDAEQARVGQEFVGLVHGSRLRILQRHDTEYGFAAGHAGERVTDGVAGKGLGVGEEGADGALAISPGLTLIGDLHGAGGYQ